MLHHLSMNESQNTTMLYEKKSLETKNSEEMTEDRSTSLLLQNRSLEDQSKISLRISEGGGCNSEGRGEIDAFANGRGVSLKMRSPFPSV